MPSRLFTDFAALQGQPGAGILMAISPPGCLPAALATEKRRVGDQLYGLFSQLLVVFRVPAVTAHQYPQAPGRGLHDLQRVLAAVVDVAAHFTVGILLALGLSQ
ncbi:hypothetical protein D3C76_542530 [compost metagenome]